MSVHVSSWAWKQKLGDPGLKLVLVKLADNADDHGYSRWRQERLADECEMSRATVQRKLTKLRELGLIEIERRANGDGFQVANGYRIIRLDAVPQSDAAVHQDGDAAAASSGEAAGTVKTKPSSSSSSNARLPKSCGGVKVTEAEHDLVDGIMAAFNEVSGKRFAGKEWRESVVRRVREHPDMSLSDHKGIIGVQFEHPWWSGEPTPAVIYGNGKAFDIAVNRVQAGPKKPREGDAYTRA